MKMARFQEDSPLLHVKVVKGCSGNTRLTEMRMCRTGQADRPHGTTNVLLLEGFHCISVVAFNTSVCSGLCSDLKAGSKLNQINKTKTKRLRQPSLPALKLCVSLGRERNLQALMFRQERSHLGLHKKRGEPVFYIL